MVDSVKARLLVGALVAPVLCFAACATNRNELSGPDGKRISAPKLELASILNDEVSAPERDATDWRLIELNEPGNLIVKMHWDNAKARLSLDLFDALGQRLQKGKPWETQGQQATVERAKKGKYYVRVEAIGDKADSSYSLEVKVEPVEPTRCHDCKVGDQICLGKDGYATCNETDEGCNAWTQTFSCPKDKSCRAGQCVEGCVDACQAGARECASDSGIRVCEKSSAGCYRWSTTRSCRSNQRCSGGVCRKRRGGRPPPPPPPPKVEKVYVSGTITTMYEEGGRRMLHIKLGPGAKGKVKRGQSGEVLRGDSSSPVGSGKIKVVKLLGDYCTASTTLTELGRNKRVRFLVR